MKYLALPVLLLAALAAGNPVITTIINEFGFDNDSTGWVELHASLYAEMDMNGWLLATNTSVCTFAFVLPRYGFLVVDSASLAGGEYGHGTFRLDPAGDTIRLEPDPDHICYEERVVFPELPARWGFAPSPPDGGSASLLNEGGGYGQSINWYVDSTPTRGSENDDYSAVTGTVSWAPGRGFTDVFVDVSGPMGSARCIIGTCGETYLVQGLGAGRYEVAASGFPGYVHVILPESLDVGYGQTVAGININFDPEGLEESRPPTACSSQPTATILAGASGVARLASGVLYDAMGRRVREPKPGVYFIHEGSGVGGQGPGKTRKVILQR